MIVLRRCFALGFVDQRDQGYEIFVIITHKVVICSHAHIIVEPRWFHQTRGICKDEGDEQESPNVAIDAYITTSLDLALPSLSPVICRRCESYFGNEAPAISGKSNTPLLVLCT